MRWREWSPPAITILVTLVAWEAWVVGFRVREYLLPAPSGILAVLAAEWRYLALHTGVTVYEILWGFFLSIVVGIPLAILIVYSPVLERAIYPLLVAAQSVPKIAIGPLLIVWAGLGIFPKVLVAFLIAFFHSEVGALTVRGRDVRIKLQGLLESGAGELCLLHLQVQIPFHQPAAQRAPEHLRGAQGGGDAGRGGRHRRRVHPGGPGARVRPPPGQRHVEHQAGVCQYPDPGGDRDGAVRHRGPDRAAPDPLARIPASGDGRGNPVAEPIPWEGQSS